MLHAGVTAVAYQPLRALQGAVAQTVQTYGKVLPTPQGAVYFVFRGAL